MCKKILLISIVSFILINSVGSIPLKGKEAFLESRINDSFIFSNLKLIEGENFFNISLEDCSCSSDIGNPILPVYIVRYIVPFGMKIKNVQVSSCNPEIIKLSKPLYPQQEEKNLDETGSFFQINKMVYQCDNFVVGNRLSDENKNFFVRGVKIVSLSIYPVDYKPVSNSLYFYKNIGLTLEFTPDPSYEKNNFLRNKQSDIELLSSNVKNPEVLSSYYTNTDLLNNDNYPGGLCNSNDNYDYVIITDQSLKTYWQPLLNHRFQKDDLTGEIVSWQEIDAESDYYNSDPVFDDSQAHMREFCKDAYLDWNAEYLLLGGTWSSNHKTCPYRLMNYYTDTNNMFVCDLYFSNLDGDWYVSYEDGLPTAYDEYFGLNTEYSQDIDYGRELYCGRLPVHNSDDVSNIVSKIIWYDNYENNDDWLSKISWVGGHLGNEHESHEYLDLIRVDHTKAWFPCPPSDGVVYNNNHPNDQIDLYNNVYYYVDLGYSYQSEFNNAFKNSEISFIIHRAHGSYTKVFGTRINNAPDKPAGGLTTSCNTMNLKHNNCEGEKMLNDEDGLYMLMAGTRSVFGGYACRCLHWFMDYYFRPHTNPCNGKAVQWYEQNFDIGTTPIRHGNWMYLHLFGDPAQTLRFSNSNPDDNLPPYMPSDPSPTYGASDVSLNVNLAWSGGDPNEGDSVVYDVYFGTDPNLDNNDLVSPGQIGLSYNPPDTLNYLTKYYWKIVARDSHNAEKSGDVWDFTTENEPIDNNPPNKPSNPNPNNRAIYQDINVDLSWSGGDPNIGDSVTYDIYFGTSSNPPRVKQNHTTTSYEPRTLSPNTQYYWKIIPWDNHDETNPGDLWSFTTAEKQHGLTISYRQFNIKEIVIDIKNLESNNISNVEWSIKMTGGMLGLIDLLSNGSINKIETGSTVTIPSDKFGFGLGYVDIITEVKNNGELCRENKDGIILGTLVLII